jgi:phosphonate transport system substrate-binding protein
MSAMGAKEAPLRLDFGVYPSDRATVMYRKFTPILEAIRIPLENQLNRDVDIHLKIFRDYDAGIEALAKGEVDFVRFGPASYILAEQKNTEIKLLAMELRKGLKRFNGLIITRADSGITSMEDLHGRSFAFGNENSTIGRFLSQSLMLEHGIDEESLGQFEYLDRHDIVARAIINGTHDAGALKSSTYKKLCDPKEIIVVKAFENVTKPWVANSVLSKEIRDAITQSLLMLENPEVISELGCSGFAEANRKEYDLVREGMKHAAGFTKSDEE